MLSESVVVSTKWGKDLRHRSGLAQPGVTHTAEKTRVCRLPGQLIEYLAHVSFVLVATSHIVSTVLKTCTQSRLAFCFIMLWVLPAEAWIRVTHTHHLCSHPQKTHLTTRLIQLLQCFPSQFPVTLQEPSE